MMVRLSESRQQRALRRLRAMGAVNLDSITHFGDTAALLGPQDQVGVALSPAPTPLAPPLCPQFHLLLVAGVAAAAPQKEEESGEEESGEEEG